MPPESVAPVLRSVSLGSDADLDTQQRWSELAVRECEREDHMYLPYARFARGLVEFRRGEFARAAEWMEKVLANTGPSVAGLRDVQALAVLAMAQHRQNQFDAARATLVRAREGLDREHPVAKRGDLRSSWHDSLTSRILLREATATIEGSGAADAGGNR